MAINLTTLFSRIGAIGHLLYLADTYGGTTFEGALVADIIPAFDVTSWSDVIGRLSALIEPAQEDAIRIIPTAQAIAVTVLNKMVNDDVRQASEASVSLSLAEVIKQMTSQAKTVAKCTVSASAAAVSGNSGAGVVVISAQRGDALEQQNLFAETATLTCTGDSQSGVATAGTEPFAFAGDQAVTNVFDEAWPSGSGASLALAACDSQLDAATNLLTNSDFETFSSANIPDRWSIITGTAGTDLASDATTFYRGSKGLKFIGGATNTAIAQKFNDATAGTALNLKPYTQYAINLWVKADVVPAAGILRVSLVDGANAIINDAAAVANSFTVTLSGITTTFASKIGTFRTPRVLPSTMKLRLDLSTAMSVGSNLFIDELAMAEMTPLYQGGPQIAIFAGAVPFVVNDAFTLTMANNRNGASYGATFQTLFDRFFGTRQLGLILPYSASPSFADTLITVP